MSIPVRHTDPAAHRRLIAQQVNYITPVVKAITLTLASATTTVIDEKMGEDRSILLTPTNSAAASENYYLQTKSNGSFVLGHANAGTTRTFDYIIF